MLVQQIFRCKDCGGKYRIISSYTTNKERSLIEEQKLPCPTCRKVMTLELVPMEGNLYETQVNKTECDVRIHGSNIVHFDPNNITVDVDTLIHVGFHGNINLTSRNTEIGTVVSIAILPIERKYSFFKGR